MNPTGLGFHQKQWIFYTGQHSGLQTAYFRDTNGKTTIRHRGLWPEQS
jgi:hypothetical protein